jgi:mannose-6-phosphate isomerase-like protein (cupin superfamily)
MRQGLCALMLSFVSTIAAAQAPPAGAALPPASLFASAGDVTAMIAKAKTSRAPDQANYTQPILRLAPYAANLEYRVAGLNANATIHDTEAEMFYVVEGSGTVVTGGTLREGRRTNPTNQAGSAIDGGDRRRVAKGDFIMVPPNTPHWFGEIDGALVLMSIHLPMTASTSGAR